jgi:hypothetical protein
MRTTKLTDQAQWNLSRAIRNLGIEQVPFEPETRLSIFASSEDGKLAREETAGYAFGNQFALNPDQKDKTGVAFHELTHIVLGHTFQRGATTRDMYLGEIEACSTSLLCLSKIGLENGTELQIKNLNWHLGTWFQIEGELPANFQSKVGSAADKILSAGMVEVELPKAA